MGKPPMSKARANERLSTDLPARPQGRNAAIRLDTRATKTTAITLLMPASDQATYAHDTPSR